MRDDGVTDLHIPKTGGSTLKGILESKFVENEKQTARILSLGRIYIRNGDAVSCIAISVKGVGLLRCLNLVFRQVGDDGIDNGLGASVYFKV